MIRRNKIIASVAVSVMAGVLVAGNLAPLQDYRDTMHLHRKQE